MNIILYVCNVLLKHTAIVIKFLTQKKYHTSAALIRLPRCTQSTMYHPEENFLPEIIHDHTSLSSLYPIYNTIHTKSREWIPWLCTAASSLELQLL